jgi:hypothetical protein
MSDIQSTVTFKEVKNILDTITDTNTGDGDSIRQGIYGRHGSNSGGWETEEELRNAVFAPRGTAFRLLDEQYLTGKLEDAWKTPLLQVLLPLGHCRRTNESLASVSMPPTDSKDPRASKRRKPTKAELLLIATWIASLKVRASSQDSTNEKVPVAPER